MQFLRPSPLQKNDKIALVATSKRVTSQEIEPAIQALESWGLKVWLGRNIYKTDNVFAGLDEERAADLQEALDNPQIKAIFCARGGYGATRILDQIDFAKLIEYPKWIIGFSDITALLSASLSKNVESVHAMMPFKFGDPRYLPSLDSLKKFLFGESYSITVKGHELNIPGTAEAPVVGGNLTMICNMIGTRGDVDTEGKILLLEDIEEYLYRIDRMMVHLKRAGKLRNLAGIIVGHMTNMLDNDPPFGKTANELIHDHVRDLNIPVCFNFPSGHEPQNMAIPFGRPARLTIEKNRVDLRFSP